MQGVSFDIGAAYRGTLRAVEGARWIVGTAAGRHRPQCESLRRGALRPADTRLARRLASPAFPPEPCARRRPRSGPPVPGRNHRSGPQEPNTPFSGTVSCAADTTSVRRTKAPATTPRWVADSLQAPCGATPHGVWAVTNSTRSTTRFSFRSDFCCKRQSASIRKERHTECAAPFFRYRSKSTPQSGCSEPRHPGRNRCSVTCR